jgi:hypothetical protein
MTLIYRILGGLILDIGANLMVLCGRARTATSTKHEKDSVNADPADTRRG